MPHVLPIQDTRILIPERCEHAHIHQIKHKMILYVTS